MDKENQPMKQLSIALLALMLALTACRRQPKDVEPAHFDLTRPSREVSAKAAAEDSLDVILCERGAREMVPRGTRYHALTSHEMVRARTILARYMAAGGGDTTCIALLDPKTDREISRKVEVRKPLPLREYYRQYMAYEQLADGHILVRIGLAAYVGTGGYPSVIRRLSEEIYIVHDGGIRYGEAVVDLTLGRVVQFHLNGLA